MPILRDELLKVCRECRESGDSVDEIIKGLSDILTFVIITTAPTDADAERNVIGVGEYMATDIRQGYREYHDMSETRRSMSLQ